MDLLTTLSTQVSQSIECRLSACRMTSFSNFLQPFPASNPPMPLVHSTSLQSFRDIVRSNVLSPTPCSVFNKDILYLFYGRPAYRVSKTITSQGQLRHFPVCFVLTPDAVQSDTVFPFDTGAYSNGLFDSFLSGLDLPEFQIGHFPDSPQKLVSAFYQTNKSYYFGRVVDSVSVAPMDFEIDAYFKMLKDTAVTYSGGPTASDDRRQTIEIQSDSKIKLTANQILSAGSVVVQNRVLATIVPERVLDDPKILDAITLIWKAEPMTYSTYAFTKPEEYHSVIREKVKELLLRHKAM
jgi:hypothetical protein